jgi:ABC-type antimicrobial peptide transport system permease subunit
VGLVVGLIVCLLQEHLGILKLGSGTEYVVSAYPVAVQATDILIVSIAVLALGFMAAWIPAKRIKN